MIERRFARVAWLFFAGAFAASCGGSSVPRSDDSDAGAEAATGGDAGNGGAVSGRGGESSGGAITGGATTGGVSSGGATTGGVSSGGATTGGFGGSAGSVRGGSGGVGRGGEAGEVTCPDSPPGGMACGGDLVGTWSVAACSLTVSGVVDFSGLGFSPECMSAPVSGSLRVTGTVIFDEMRYSDRTTTSGESTFELAPECLQISGTVTTCDVLGRPIQSLGYDSVTCVPKATTGGCTCTGTVLQIGGLAFASFEATTSGTYTTAGNELTLTSFGDPTEYSYCVSEDAQRLTLSLKTAARIGTVVDSIVLVKP